MQVNTLRLTDFRNYAEEEISFSPGTNVIYGNNAQGKTNLLEAICLFSFGRSKRARSDSELIRFGRDFFRLTLTFSDSKREYVASMQAATNGKKSIKINNVPLRRLSQLLSYLNVVMFSPSDLDIVQGSPSVRRRFLDEAISQMYPKYMANLSEYHKALDQKNKLLKQLRLKGTRSDGMLTIWNEQLAESGTEIYLKRKEFIENLGTSAARVQSEISKEKLKIDYTPSINCGIIEDIKERTELENTVKSALFRKLEDSQAREIDLGSSILGVQRDDFTIKIGENDARLYASQGQQRTAVLSLKLAQTEFIKEERGEYPVLLLDDIMSELDVERRHFLAGKISGKQVLITTTDAEDAEKNPGTSYFKIENGRLANVSSSGE